MTRSSQRGGHSSPAGPIRVMHLVFTLRSGGMEHGVVKIVNGLSRAHVVSSICSTTPADPAMRATVNEDVRVIELNRQPGNNPRIVWELYRVLRRERPDIVHTHAWGTLLEGLAAARLARVPVVVHGEHGTLQLGTRQIAVQRRAWRYADQLLSVSSRLAERMVRDVGIPLESVRVIRNGVDLSRFGDTRSAAVRRTFGVPDEGSVVIGAVGRLVPVKDHETLIDAVDLLRRNGSPVHAVIAGDGPLTGALQARIASRGLERFVRLLGHRSDVEAVLAGLDVFVQSSTSEGMSNTILEAMAAGLPVVATRVGGADEMVAEGVTGLLVPASNPGEMAGALARLIGDRTTREEMGHAGRQRAVSEFSLQTMIERYQLLYCDLAKREMGRLDATQTRQSVSA